MVVLTVCLVYSAVLLIATVLKEAFRLADTSIIDIIVGGVFVWLAFLCTRLLFKIQRRREDRKRLKRLKEMQDERT